MTDLSKALKVESLDEASYENDKHVRTNAIASLPSSSPAEKSLHRQMVDNNLARNSLETILRHVNTINPSPGDAENIFNANKKKKLQEDLRAALLQNYECKAFLKVAKQYGYQAADEFKEGNRADDNAESEEMKKRMEEIRKNYASSVKPPTRQPMKQQQSYKQSQYQDSFSHGNLYTGQIPQLQVPQPPALPMFHGGYPVAFQGAPAPPAQFTYPSFPQYNRPRARFPKPPIDKSNSSCKACQGQGHWAGDMECPLSGFPATRAQQQPRMPLPVPGLPPMMSPSTQAGQSLQGSQPPPPGSG